MKLLIEPIFEETSVKEVIEEGTQEKKLYISGPFWFHSVKNKNGRIYPEHIADREVEKFQSIIESGQAVGELDHPDSPKINLHNISHRITTLKKEGQAYMGRALILDTPSGKIAKSLINNGVKIGISSRALGSLSEGKDGKVVNEDLHLITWDLVARPSFSDALMNTVYENKEWDIVEGKIVEKIVGERKTSNEEIKILLEEIKKYRDLYFKQLIINQLSRK